MDLHWMYSEEANNLAAEDPAALSLRLAKDFQDSSRNAAAAGDSEEAARHRRVSDGYLDDAISRRQGEQA
ncbi:hypothetical protein Caci_2869 [Catenulispora acidiphila DSM 44928]|uniref:Uncharacterized protein n=1 Tax=Catenulispora acidiphila (strain DSM 44928 / JCM 14897 / NBRC 102108 / NRRL B-24433 / ID139908) TaxID=479433 RepID=C7Q1A3_CATAD|nr:hypothetical protein [Catenulispora acidiphila]ACU71778.1 hypothetical protein Caci_2869 [Catenulispora acidiphila DSM 44928]